MGVSVVLFIVITIMDAFGNHCVSQARQKLDFQKKMVRDMTIRILNKERYFIPFFPPTIQSVLNFFLVELKEKVQCVTKG